MSDIDISKALIESIQNQSGLLLSLTTALLGGTAALMVQMKIRQSEILPLKLNGCLVFGIILLGLSCISSWLVVGAVINKIPVIMSLDFDGRDFSRIPEIGEATALTLLANLQFWFFLVGAILTTFGLTKLER